MMRLTQASTTKPGRKQRWKRIVPFYLMVLPGFLYLLINNYIPMFGALLAGLMYKWKPKSLMACLGELVGTGLIGSIAVYPIAKFVMGKDVAAFAYVVPFSLAAVVGAVCAMAVILLLERTGAMKKLRDTAE